MTTTGEYARHARHRAIWATVGFSLWSVLVVIVRPPSWRVAWPLVVFHILLLVNTFFSIRAFATLIPSTAGQWAFDIALGLCMVFAPLTFNYPIHFAFLVLLLFILATYKYVLAIPLTGLPEMLYRKIVIDLLGVVGTFAAVVAMWQGFVFPAAVLGATAFVAGNVYVLWLKPLYRMTPFYSNGDVEIRFWRRPKADM
jgi:hypothetical protein